MFKEAITINLVLSIFFLAFPGLSQNVSRLGYLSNEEFFIKPDQLIRNNAIKTRECFSCKKELENTKKCNLIERISYNSAGRIVKWIQGPDINKSKIDRIIDFVFDSVKHELVVTALHPKKGRLYEFSYLYSQDEEGRMIPKFDSSKYDSIRVIVRYEKLDTDTIEKQVVINENDLLGTCKLLRGMSRKDMENIPKNIVIRQDQTYWGFDSTLVEDRYNKYGQLIESSIFLLFNKAKQLVKKSVFYYNAKGFLSCEMVVDSALITYGRKTYEYFNGGQLEHFFEESDGMFLEMRYDSLGNNIETKIRDRFSDKVRVDLSEFENGLIKKECFLLNNKLDEVKIYRYK